jgi:hypothetical protein
MCEWYIGKRVPRSQVVFPWLKAERGGERVPVRIFDRRGLAEQRGITLTLAPEAEEITELRRLVAEADLNDAVLAVGVAYLVAVAANGQPPNVRMLARQAGVGVNAVGPHLEALRRIAPQLFPAPVVERATELRAEFSDRGEEWAGVVHAIEVTSFRGAERPRFVGDGLEVARELAACRFRGEAMPSVSVLAGRCGVSEVGVAEHIHGLELHHFEFFPHPNDARQAVLDALHSQREGWDEKMRLLRRRFPELTKFRVAREFLAGLLADRELPSDRKVERTGEVTARTTAAYRQDVLSRAADILVLIAP